MDLIGWSLGLLWIGSLFTMGLAYIVVYYLPLVIAFFAFTGVMLFLMCYIVIKKVIKNIFCGNSERNLKIITITNMILDVIKAFVSAGSYLLLFGSMVWLRIQFGSSFIIFPVLVILFIQLIAVLVLKFARRLNAVYFTIFLLIEPYLFLYILIGDYYSKGLLFGAM